MIDWSLPAERSSSAPVETGEEEAVGVLVTCFFGVFLVAVFFVVDFFAVDFFAADFFAGAAAPIGLAFLEAVFFAILLVVLVFSSLTSFGSLSSRKPMNMGCRAIPSFVHSVN